MKKIGKGPLDLVVASSFLNEEELRRIAQKVLSIYPLGNIFSVSKLLPCFEHFGLPDTFRRARELYKGGADLFALLTSGNKGEYFLNEGIVVSSVDPITLAHEIGHALGLEHPNPLCWKNANSPTCHCLSEGYIMGYCRGKRTEFSTGDTRRLLELL